MKKALLSFLLIAMSMGAMAQQKIQLRSADNAECVKSDMKSLKASFSFSTIVAENMETKGGQYSCLSLANTVIGGNEGEPQIPVINELIAVPVGAKPTIKVTSYNTTEYKLSDLGVKTLIPRQPSLRKDKKPEDVPFIKNEAAYQSSRNFRSEPRAMVNVVGTMRGVQLGKMTIEPVSYNPVNNTIRVFNDIVVEVSFDGADAKATEKLLIDSYSPYFDIVYKSLFNGKAVLDAYTQHPDLYKTPVKMLVVATSEYQNSTAFQNWLTWKKQKGIYVDIYTVTSSTTSSTIQSEIYSRYNSNHPTFLVIVGDETVVKAYKTNWSCGSSYGNCINDMEYASVDGDVYHDMFMSRMSVSSTTELGNLVNKILTYEKYTMSNPSYLNNSLLVAGWDSNWTSKVGKPTIQYANNNYYNSAHGINPTVYITTGSGQTAAWNNINNVGFVNYTAHGDIQELADPEFTNSNANSMTNNDKYLWIVANCCLTANWGNNSYKPCLGETMIRAANKGAFGYIGSIPESYWYEDYYFGVGAFSYVASTVQTPSSTTTGMYDALFDDNGFNTLNSVPYIGNVAVTYAHAAGYTSSVTDEYYWRAYQCLGDGSVMPYLNNPSANSVSHASTINIGATTFQVNAHAGSYVAITKNNEILGVAQADASGTANVTISGLTSAGDVMIVVTRNQRQPYITTIQAVSTSGPYLTLDSYTPNTALIGQSTNLNLTFKNVGTAATTGTTTVTLSSADSHVNFGTSTKTFSSLAANATTTVSGFSFTLNNGVTLGDPVTLHYKAVNGSNTWEGDITITPNQIFNVTVAANNANYGTVSGGGQYNYNQSCTVTATPSDGYMFTNWTSNGSVVSTDASYTFNVTANTNLMANFTAGITVYDGTATNQYIPMYGYYFDDFTKSECIIPASQLTAMTGCTVSSITFYPSSVGTTNSTWTSTSQTVFLKEVSSTTLGGSFSGTTGATTVKQGLLEMPTAGQPYTITFDAPYTYNGGNLLIGVYNTDDGSYNKVEWYGTSNLTSGVSAYGNNSSSLNSVTYNAQSFLPKTTFNYIPSTTPYISLAPNSATLLTGSTETLTATYGNVSGTPSITYTSSNTSVATVSGSGTSATVTAVASGTATITATMTVNGTPYTATCDVTVENPSYCTPNPTSRDGQGITTLTFGSGDYVVNNNNSNGLPASSPYYGDYTSMVGGYGAGETATVTITYSTGSSTVYSYGTLIWVDWNKNYTFEDSEIVYTGTSAQGSGGTPQVLTATFAVPASQTADDYRMRIAGADSYFDNYIGGSASANHDPCFTSTWAVCHDYTLRVTAVSTDPVEITASVNPANAGTVSGTGIYDPGTTVTLTATANEGYTFSHWTRNGVVISSNATYSFTVSNAVEYVANFTLNSYTVTASAEPAEYGTVTVGSSKGNRDDLVYDFEDGWQGWTTFQGNTTSPNSWMHNTAYPTSNNDFSTGYGYNSSDGFMLSESYISGTSSGAGTAVTPDNYLVSPQVRLGGSISFYAGARNTSYCAEKFSVMVSTTDNTNATSFTTVATWTLSLSSAGYNDTPYTVDLSAYSGMGYIAIRHFDCYDQWFIAVDNVTIVEGPDNSTGSGNFNHGETCVVTATPNTDYYFVNWTENGTVVSTDASYSFTVTADRDLVANFSDQPATTSQTINLAQGWSWWSTYLDITLEDLQDALVAALPGTQITIKSQNDGSSIYYVSNNRWRGSLESLDVAQMYEIYVSSACTINLTGSPVDPTEHPITVHNGTNWIGFPHSESMSLNDAFDFTPTNGDILKSKNNGSTTYSGGQWRGELTTLEPGQGYIYTSRASGNKGFTSDGSYNQTFIYTEGQEAFTVYPNPANRNEDIILQIPNGFDQGTVTVEVFNAIGNMVKSEVVSNKSRLSGFSASGVYTIRVTDSKGNVCYTKLVIR
ncbi:MAG: choice-of-anchor J domain-containing protein [Bacteroidales bacterium]|nr:choice-of-anchor J domain-containing protein [Bacteroidales bacterium]